MCFRASAAGNLICAALAWCVLASAQSIPGTAPLKWEGDFASRMLEGIDSYLTRELAASAQRRSALWRTDTSSRGAYQRSVSSNRERFRGIIGLKDPRVEFASPELTATLDQAAEVAAGKRYRVFAVRWPAVEGLDAEGLLLVPSRPALARVVAIPDASQTPEMIAGLAQGLPFDAQFARRLAESGCEVLVPVVISRRPAGIVEPLVPRPTNIPHREVVYRMAFEMGRHVIGYEVQKVLAAVDWMSRRSPRTPIGVAGYGEGGLLALYSAASDTRIDAALVSGYFQRREGVWREPVDRNVWGLLAEFGDAELACLIAPRSLVVESSRWPETAGPAPPAKGERDSAAPGKLSTPTEQDVRLELERAKPVFAALNASLSVASGMEQALVPFLSALGVPAAPPPRDEMPADRRPAFDAAERERRQFIQMVRCAENAVRHASFEQKKFWSNAGSSSVESWNNTKQEYKRHLWDEIFGRLPQPTDHSPVLTRLLDERSHWIAHEVLLPLYPDVFAYGVLLVPKDLTPGERRPVVVTQHGKGDYAADLVQPRRKYSEFTFKRVAARLADEGFIVFSPQNPYIFEERYRLIQRKANPLKLSLFSFILAQHERTLEWLSGLPFVDPSRIAFYGLSYGGKTAVRVPPLLDRYALSICSADFNEYTGKMAAVDRTDSFMYVADYEMYEFNLGSTFNYSDLANLLAPKPFMVERGHKDPVGMDEWVAYEYAKTKRFYTYLGVPGNTEIEYFDGAHEMRVEGTLQFLKKHLNWRTKR